MFVNNDVDTPHWKIWNDRFLCQMKYIDTMSVDYIKIFGTLTTFDSELDRQSHNEIVDRYLTVIKMVEYFNDGIPVYIKHPEDSKKIYILIQEHLQNWAKELQVSLRSDKAPLEELEIMDRFAEKVYEHAKWYLDDALVGTPFARSLQREEQSVLNMLKEPTEAKDENSTILQPSRQSMATVFSQKGVILERKF